MLYDFSGQNISSALIHQQLVQVFAKHNSLLKATFTDNML